MLDRRAMIAGLAAAMPAAAQFGATGPAPAQVRLLVGFPAGTTADQAARLYAAEMQAHLRAQAVVVENRVGAGGMLAAEAVARAAPDGATLLVASNGPIVVNRHIGARLAYDPERDLTPIGMLGVLPQLLVAHPSQPATLAAFLDQARTREQSFASVGNGSGSHMVMAGLVHAAGLRMQHVPYRGGPQAVTDLVAGRVEAMVLAAGSVLPLVRDGQLRCLAQTGPARLVEGVPTFGEAGFPGLDLPVWNALFAPAPLTAEVSDRLIIAVRLARVNTALRQTMQAAGNSLPSIDGSALVDFLRAESEKWKTIADATGVRMDS